MKPCLKCLIRMFSLASNDYIDKTKFNYKICQAENCVFKNKLYIEAPRLTLLCNRSNTYPSLKKEVILNASSKYSIN